MSKQSEAKAAQGYTGKPPQQICSTCKHFAMTRTETPACFGTYTTESNLRCTLGNFAVKKTATCNKFEPKA